MSACPICESPASSEFLRVRNRAQLLTRRTSRYALGTAIVLVAGLTPLLVAQSQPRDVSVVSARGLPAEQSRPRRILSVRGESETVTVPMVTEPWSATAVSRPPAQRKVIRFVGHFPGFEEAKRNANFRTHQAARSSPYVQAAVPTTAGSPSTQAVVFEGPNESDTPYVPPNPGVAAGPNYIVVLINSLIAIYDKSGNLQGGYNELSAFFSSLGITGDIYDPRVIYDQNDGRFIMSFTNVDLSNPTFGNVLIAVSQTSDPTGNWYKFILGSKGFNVRDNAVTFPDFPTLGLSQSAVYISNGQFELNSYCIWYGGCSFSDTWLRVIGLPELLSGNPSLKVTTFTNVKTVTGFPAFAIEPALTYGASSEEFLAAAEILSGPRFHLECLRHQHHRDSDTQYDESHRAGFWHTGRSRSAGWQHRDR